jgi:CRP-like cAMP-binding protein
MSMGNAFVEKLAALVELPESDIRALEGVTSGPRKYKAKHDLIREGDHPGPVFVVLDGWACRYKILPSGTRQIMALLMPGDACDLHVGMLDAMDHSIQTITPATVATISRDKMQTLLADHPRIARAMYLAQLVDEGVLRSWIVSMGRRSSIERAAHLVCELYLRAQNRGPITSGEIDLPLSQIILADALGMTPVHINRVLKQLRVSGAMTLNRNSMKVLDAATLVQIAGFDENYLHRRVRQFDG